MGRQYSEPELYEHHGYWMVIRKYAPDDEFAATEWMGWDMQFHSYFGSETMQTTLDNAHLVLKAWVAGRESVTISYS